MCNVCANALINRGGGDFTKGFNLGGIWRIECVSVLMWGFGGVCVECMKVTMEFNTKFVGSKVAIC